MTSFLIGLLLCIGFAILAFAPRKIAGSLFKIAQGSRCWARLAGVLGLSWLFLGFIVDPPPSSGEEAGRARLSMARSMCGGVVIGLMIALGTKRYEQSGTDRSARVRP
jgi:hypothetical protein